MTERNAGFTLLELMVAVAVIGILAAIALPSYEEFMRKGRRSEARNAMLEMAQMQERYFSNNLSYIAVAGAPAASSFGQNYSGKATAPTYSIAVAASAGLPITASFTITATIASGYADPSCGTMTLNNLGDKSPAACW